MDSIVKYLEFYVMRIDHSRNHLLKATAPPQESSWQGLFQILWVIEGPSYSEGAFALYDGIVTKRSPKAQRG